MNLASNLYKFWLIRKTFDAFSRNRIFQNNHSKLAQQYSFSSRNMSNKGPTQGAAWYDRKKGFQLYHLYWKWLLISKILLLGRISLNVIDRNLEKKTTNKILLKQTNKLFEHWPLLALSYLGKGKTYNKSVDHTRQEFFLRNSMDKIPKN